MQMQSSGRGLLAMHKALDSMKSKRKTPSHIKLHCTRNPNVCIHCIAEKEFNTSVCAKLLFVLHVVSVVQGWDPPLACAQGVLAWSCTFMPFPKAFVCEIG